METINKKVYPEYIGKKKRFKIKVSKINSEIHEYMNSKKSEKVSLDNWEILLVDLTTRLKFGKHKGKTIEKIMNEDFKYIIWLFKDKIVALDKTNKGLYYTTKKILELKYTQYKESLKPGNNE